MWKWWICGILFLATVLNYLDRQTMAICNPLICEEFRLNNEQWGELLAAFRFTYAFAQLGGFLVDRLSVRVVYALAVGLWSAAGAAAAFVSTPRALGWTRSALGVGEAFNWPCALRVTANMLPPEDRGLANGFFASGAAMGGAIAPIVIGPIALAFGWRAAFFAIGSLGALWIAIWWVATRRPGSLGQTQTASHASQAARGPRLSLAAQVRAMLIHPGFWLLVLVASTINPCSYFIAEWIPKYLHDQRGFGLLAAGLISTPIFLGTDVGSIAGGALVKYLAARGVPLGRARGTTLALSAALVLPAAIAGVVGNAYICIALLVVAAMGLAAITANYLAALQDISLASVGLIAGVLGALSNLVAWRVNPLVGRYVDQTGHYHLVFVLLGVLPLVGWLALVAFDTVIARRRNKG